MEHADIALLGCHVSLGEADLLLGGDGTGLNFLEELLSSLAGILSDAGILRRWGPGRSLGIVFIARSQP